MIHNVIHHHHHHHIHGLLCIHPPGHGYRHRCRLHSNHRRRLLHNDHDHLVGVVYTGEKAETWLGNQRESPEGSGLLEKSRYGDETLIRNCCHNSSGISLILGMIC